MRAQRLRNNWTQREMSQRTGIPISTLSKVEHDRLTLGYVKLLQVSQGLGMPMSELLSNADSLSSGQILGRRSFGTLRGATRVKTPNYEYFLLCGELRKKLMTPFIARILTKSLHDFGELVRYTGEEFIYVLSGRVAVHTEFYEPAMLEPGECMYMDSNMGHAYVAPDRDEATVLGCCAGPADALIEHLRGTKPLGGSAGQANHGWRQRTAVNTAKGG